MRKDEQNIAWFWRMNLKKRNFCTDRKRVKERWKTDGTKMRSKKD